MNDKIWHINCWKKKSPILDCYSYAYLHKWASFIHGKQQQKIAITTIFKKLPLQFFPSHSFSYLGFTALQITYLYSGCTTTLTFLLWDLMVLEFIMILNLAIFSTYDSDVCRIFQPVLVTVTVLKTIWTAKLAFRDNIFLSFSLTLTIGFSPLRG